MIPEALEAKIVELKESGYRPFFVCATAGTTVYGSFDPINEIADICARHGLWLHVDVSEILIEMETNCNSATLSRPLLGCLGRRSFAFQKTPPLTGRN